MVASLRSLVAGRGGTLLVEGRQGTGKSHLLAVARSAAGEKGVTVVCGAADELRQLAPLSPLAAALGEQAPPMPPRSTDTVDLRLLLVERVRSHLEEQVARGPMLITLDDLHWADPTTRLALRALVPDLASYPLLWMLSRTSGSGDPSMDRLFMALEKEGATRLTLHPLSGAAVAEIAADVLEAAPGPDVLELMAAAMGNPVLLVELLRACEDEGVVEVAQGHAKLASAQRIQTITRSRLVSLSAQTRHLLQVAGILGRSFALEDLAEMLDRPVSRLLPALDEAMAAGVLVPVADVLAFRHDLLWQAVGETLTEPVRRALHRQAGEMLLKREGSVAMAAAHLMRSARPGDARALSGLDRAAREVLPSAPQAAADLATRALELTEVADADRFGRMVTMVDALTAAGRLSEATELAHDALGQHPTGPDAAKLRYELASILLLGGRPAEAVEEAEKLLARQDLTAELRGLAELAVFRGLIALHDFWRGSERAGHILAQRGRFRDTAVVGALMLLMHAAWADGRAADALRHIREAIGVAADGSIEAQRTHPRLYLARCLMGIGRFAEAETVIQDAADEIEALGHTAHAASPALFRAGLRLDSGRLDDAAAEAEAGMNIADELGTHKFALLGLAVLAIVSLRHLDIDTAARHIDRYKSECALHGVMFGAVWGTWAMALVGEARDGPERARELLNAAYTDPQERRLLLMEETNAAAWMTRVALAVGDDKGARMVVETADSLARGNPDFPALATAAAHARGILHRDLEALAFAAAHSRDPWAAASAAEDRGGLLAFPPGRTAVDANTEAAIACLEVAADGFQRIGATRDMARVRARLRDLGVRRRHWSYADRPVSGWASLTETEGNVAALVARGLTNRQVATRMFVSPHTVSFHLRQIFRKLGIASRVDLARIAAERPPEPPHA